MSKALEMIRSFYVAGVTRKSLTVWKRRMIHGISAVIESGFEFDPDDFKTIMSWHNTAWVNENTLESFYALATGMRHRDEVRNSSALIALERYLNRPVYNFDGGRLYEGRSLYLRHEWPCPKDRGWCNRWWAVSSFRDGANPSVLLRCARSGDMARKFVRLTAADVRALEKARKLEKESTAADAA